LPPVIAMTELARDEDFVLRKWRDDVWIRGGLAGAWKRKWAMALLNLRMIGMVMAMLVSGYEQSQIERAIPRFLRSRRQLPDEFASRGARRRLQDKCSGSLMPREVGAAASRRIVEI